MSLARGGSAAESLSTKQLLINRARPEGGYLIYMAGHEGRGIGLWAKAATYLLQDAGENTYWPTAR